MSVKKQTHYPKPAKAINDDLGPAVSSTDCTGLIPAGLTEDEELAAYEELYAFLPLCNQSSPLQNDKSFHQNKNTHIPDKI